MLGESGLLHLKLLLFPSVLANCLPLSCLRLPITRQGEGVPSKYDPIGLLGAAWLFPPCLALGPSQSRQHLAPPVLGLNSYDP